MGCLPPGIIEVDFDDIEVARIVGIDIASFDEEGPEGLEAVPGGGHEVDIEEGEGDGVGELIQGILEESFYEITDLDITVGADVGFHFFACAFEHAFFVVAVYAGMEARVALFAVVGQALEGVADLEPASGHCTDMGEAGGTGPFPYATLHHMAFYFGGNGEDGFGENKVDYGCGAGLNGVADVLELLDEGGAGLCIEAVGCTCVTVDEALYVVSGPVACAESVEFALDDPVEGRPCTGGVIHFS